MNRRGVSTVTTSSAAWPRVATASRGATGCRQHHTRGATSTQHVDRGPRRRPGRDAVVHQDHGSPLDRHRWALAAVPTDAALELGPFSIGDRADRRVVDADARDQLLVEHRDVALGDRPHAELGLPRAPELAHDEDVEGGAQRPRHLGGDRHPATGQRHDDDRLVAIGSQTRRQLPSGIDTIAERHGHRLQTGSPLRLEHRRSPLGPQEAMVPGSGEPGASRRGAPARPTRSRRPVERRSPCGPARHARRTSRSPDRCRWRPSRGARRA